MCCTVQGDPQDTSGHWNSQHKKVMCPIRTNSTKSVHNLQFAFSTKQGKYPAYTKQIYDKLFAHRRSFGKL